MIGSSTAEVALQAVLQDPDLDDRLLRCRKTIVAAESGDLKTTHRLGQSLRRVLRSITDDPKATLAQREQAADLYQRQRQFDPRVLDRKAEQEAEEEAANPGRREYDPEDRLQEAIAKSRLESSKPVLDGFEPNFVNAVEAVARIVTKYGSHQPQWSDNGHAEVLQTALVGLVLDEHSVRQLWLSLANAHRNGSFPNGEHRTLLAHVCAFSNERKIALPTPNCFTSIREELSFRS